MRKVLGLAAGHGLLTVTGNEHKNMRKAMNPAFSIPNLTVREFSLLAMVL
jgi:cytochrome P450